MICFSPWDNWCCCLLLPETLENDCSTVVHSNRLLLVLLHISLWQPVVHIRGEEGQSKSRQRRQFPVRNRSGRVWGRRRRELGGRFAEGLKMVKMIVKVVSPWMTSPCISGEDKVKFAGEQCRGAQAEQLERLKVIMVMMMVVVVVMMLVTMIFMRTVMLIMMMTTFFDLAMAQAHIICE